MFRKPLWSVAVALAMAALSNPPAARAQEESLFVAIDSDLPVQDFDVLIFTGNLDAPVGSACGLTQPQQAVLVPVDPGKATLTWVRVGEAVPPGTRVRLGRFGCRANCCVFEPAVGRYPEAFVYLGGVI